MNKTQIAAFMQLIAHIGAYLPPTPHTRRACLSHADGNMQGIWQQQ